ncbi:MAG: ABC transporter ATP-binding protein [Clostridia bacterium]|nr:ABC transporter ATP-binding protein [Clostridia bacterium]
MARNRYSDDEKDTVKISTSLLKRLFKYMLPYNKLFLGGICLLVVNVLISLLWPLITQWIIDDVLAPEGSFYNNTAVMLTVVISAGVMLILNVFLSSLRVRTISKLGHNSINDIRNEIFAHLQTLSFKFFDDRPAGKILVRVTSYIDGLAGLLSSSLIQLFVDFFTLVCIIVILVSLNWRLFLLSFSVLLPLIIFIMFMRLLIAKFARLLRTKASNRTAYIHENIMGVTITQAFNRKDENLSELDRLDGEVNNVYFKQHLSATSIIPAVDIFSAISIILVYYVSIGNIEQGTMTLGALTAFCAYLTRFWQPISSFMLIFNQFSEATGNIEKVFETMDTPADIKDAPDAYPLPQISGCVEYKNVTFSYDGSENILENVSFSVAPGEMAAFVGPTGAGKTTVVNLLSRFYDVSAGSVLIDGHNVKDVTLSSLRTQVGVMMQDSFIFSGTVIDNIRYGRPEATDEECILAAEKVYAADFIKKLPNGYYTHLDERGTSLSSGERQLLSFARVILTDPKILILDEATSNIDTQTELLVQKALKEVLSGRTSFVIAHRLSTIKNADKIMCICNKGIAEEGTHEELMKKKGIYYELNMSQYNALSNK